jgi:hypothetical protein
MMQYSPRALLILATFASVAQDMPRQGADSAAKVPPIRPVPTLVPLRPSRLDSTPSMAAPRAVAERRESSGTRSPDPRVLGFALIGAVAGGFIGYNIGLANAEPDCRFCLFSEVDKSAKAALGLLIGAGLGGFIGAMVGALTGR